MIENLFKNNIPIRLVTDTDLRIVASNQPGYEDAETEFPVIAGASIFSVFPFLNAAEIEQIKTTCLRQTTRSEKLEVRSGINGSARHFTWMICAVTDHQGNAAGLQWVGIETTSNKRKKELLHFQQVVLENISDALVTLDSSMNVTAFNKKAEEVYGLSAGAVIGRRLNDFFFIQPVDHSNDALLAALDKKGSWQGAFQLQKITGEVLYVYSQLVAVKNDCGDLLGYVSVNRDVTGHHQLQQEHQKETAIKTLLQEIMDQTGALTWATDGEGYKQYMNATYRQALGVTPDKERIHLSDLFSGVELKKMLEDNKRILEQNVHLETIEEVTIDADQKAKYRSIKFPVHTINGTFAAGFALDITKELLREEELAHLKQRFEKAARIIADVIVDWDIEQDILWRSDPENGMEVHPDMATSMELRYRRIHANDVDQFKQSLQDALQSDAESWQYEYRYNSGTKEGVYKVLHEKAVIMRDEYGKAKRMISVVQDVTEQRRLQKILKEKENAIINATIEGQEAERSELARELHDNVGQVLAMCKLFVDIAADSVKHEYLEKCKDHLQKAIGEIRDLSHRLSPETLSRNGLPATITDMVGNINQTGRLQMSVKFCDRFEITELPRNIQTTAYRIVQECISNILKHANAKCASLVLCIREGLLHIEIRDNGKGFDLEQARSGIGLKNIHSRIEMSGGKLHLETAPDKGCSIFVQLPLAIG